MPMGFQETEFHIHYEDSCKNENRAVAMSYYLSGEVHVLNRKSADSMESSIKRLLLNIKKKKLLKNIHEKNSEGKRNGKKSNSKAISSPSSVKLESQSASDSPVNVSSTIFIVQDGQKVDTASLTNASWISGMKLVVANIPNTNEVASDSEPAVNNSTNIDMSSLSSNDGDGTTVLLELTVIVNPPLITNIKTFPLIILDCCPLVALVTTTSPAVSSSTGSNNASAGTMTKCAHNHTTPSNPLVNEYMVSNARELEVDIQYAWYAAAENVDGSIFDSIKYFHTGCTTHSYTPSVSDLANVCVDSSTSNAHTGRIRYKLKVFCTPRVISDTQEGGYIYGRCVVYYVPGYVDVFNHKRWSTVLSPMPPLAVAVAAHFPSLPDGLPIPGSGSVDGETAIPNPIPAPAPAPMVADRQTSESNVL